MLAFPLSTVQTKDGQTIVKPAKWHLVALTGWPQLSRADCATIGLPIEPVRRAAGLFPNGTWMAFRARRLATGIIGPVVPAHSIISEFLRPRCMTEKTSQGWERRCGESTKAHA